MEGDSNYACAGGGGSIVLCMYIYLLPIARGAEDARTGSSNVPKCFWGLERTIAGTSVVRA